MKQTYYSLIILLCGMLQVGCNSESLPADPAATGSGTFALSLITESVQTENITRADMQFDLNSFRVTLKDNKDVTLINAKAFGQLSDGDRALPVGTGYRIAVESCTKEESTTANEGWGAIRFTGNETFNIESNKTTEVTIGCTMDNAGLQLVFDKSFVDKFPTYAATTQDARLLVFKRSNPDAIAYYEVPEFESNIKISLRITGSAGGWSDRIDLKKDIELKRGKINKLSVIYDENTGDIDINIGTGTDMGNTSDDVTIE